MVEQASSRFTEVWKNAAKFPKVMDAAASTATSSGQFTAAAGTATLSRRSSAARAPSFGTVVTNAATGAEVPSVTSGIQKCAGTPPALNMSPATTAMTPAAATPCGPAASAVCKSG